MFGESLPDLSSVGILGLCLILLIKDVIIPRFSKDRENLFEVLNSLKQTLDSHQQVLKEFEILMKEQTNLLQEQSLLLIKVLERLAAHHEFAKEAIRHMENKV